MAWLEQLPPQAGSRTAAASPASSTAATRGGLHRSRLDSDRLAGDGGGCGSVASGMVKLREWRASAALSASAGRVRPWEAANVAELPWGSVRNHHDRLLAFHLSSYYPDGGKAAAPLLTAAVGSRLDQHSPHAIMGSLPGCDPISPSPVKEPRHA
jgi:hypothetical protein